MPNKSEFRLLCEEYCDKYPKMKGLTLATKIYNENKKIYPNQSIENIRKAHVNSIRGLNGERARKYQTDKAKFKKHNYDTVNSKTFKEEIDTTAKILILDIETAPGRGFFWDVWNQNINPEMILDDWFMLTWSAKYLFENKVYSARLTGTEAIKQNDKRILQSLWEILNKSDVVIAHNGDKFDIPRLNTRFIINRIKPPLPYQTIDTLKTLRRQFAFFHNKLDFVNRMLNLPRKTKTEGFPMWAKCYDGNEKALKDMERYNIQDVRSLEDTYLRLRPWIKPHPNVGLFILDENSYNCPSCGSSDLQDEGKKYYTTANAYEQFRCKNCDAVGRKRTSAITVKQKRHLLLSVPK